MATSGPPHADVEGAGDRLRLKVVAGNAAGTVIEVQDELLIGRQASGDGALGSDIEISRRHARIASGTDDRFVIEDLGSTNGTYVNGRRIEAPTVLETGDRIELGATTLVVQVGAIPPTPPQGTEVPISAEPADSEEPRDLAPGPSEVDERPPSAPPSETPERISLRIELDLEQKKATVVLDEDSEELELVLEDGRWRVG